MNTPSGGGHSIAGTGYATIGDAYADSVQNVAAPMNAPESGRGFDNSGYANVGGSAALDYDDMADVLTRIYQQPDDTEVILHANGFGSVAELIGKMQEDGHLFDYFDLTTKLRNEGYETPKVGEGAVFVLDREMGIQRVKDTYQDILDMNYDQKVAFVYSAEGKEYYQDIEQYATDEEKRKYLTALFGDDSRYGVTDGGQIVTLPAPDVSDPESPFWDTHVKPEDFDPNDPNLGDAPLKPEMMALHPDILEQSLSVPEDDKEAVHAIISGLSDNKGGAIVYEALTRVGDPYSQPMRGREDYVDCSYFVWWVMNEAGIDYLSDAQHVPVAATQAKYCVDNDMLVSKDELMPGDIVFWRDNTEDNGRFGNISHVGIYAGDGYVIDASTSKGRVTAREIWGERSGSDIEISYYARPY